MLYAQIEGGACHCAIEDELKMMNKENIYNIGHPRNIIRKSDVRAVFAKAFQHLKSTIRKPVNDPLVNDIKRFFLYASLAGFKTSKDLVEALDVSGLDCDHIKSLSSIAMAQNIVNKKRRQKGRELRIAMKGWLC